MLAVVILLELVANDLNMFWSYMVFTTVVSVRFDARKPRMVCHSGTILLNLPCLTTDTTNNDNNMTVYK